MLYYGSFFVRNFFTNVSAIIVPAAPLSIRARIVTGFGLPNLVLSRTKATGLRCSIDDIPQHVSLHFEYNGGANKKFFKIRRFFHREVLPTMIPSPIPSCSLLHTTTTPPTITVTSYGRIFE